MTNISKEILHIRRKRLESLIQKYRDKLSNSPTEITRISDQARIDELELQIESINELLATQLEPFSPKRSPKTHRRAEVEKGRRTGKENVEVTTPMREALELEGERISMEDEEAQKKKHKSLFQE